MIRFSKMADYGVLLLGHLARQDGISASASEMADATHMPRPVVANLLKSFREVGLLDSRRGLHGGYWLVRTPDEITLLDVLSAVDGPVQLTDCAVADLTSQCDYEDVCLSRSPMKNVHERIVDLLRSTTLTELMSTVSDPTLPASSS